MSSRLIDLLDFKDKYEIYKETRNAIGVELEGKVCVFTDFTNFRPTHTYLVRALRIAVSNG